MFHISVSPTSITSQEKMKLILTLSPHDEVIVEATPGLTFADVHQRAMSMLDNTFNNCSLKYIDFDGDEVTIANDIDLTETFAFMKEMGMTVIKVGVKPRWSFLSNSMQQHLLDVVTTITKQMETDFNTIEKPPTVKEVFEIMYRALNEWQVSEDATAIQYLKPDLLEVVSSAQLVQTIELLSSTTKYSSLVKEILNAVYVHQPIEVIIFAHWDEVVDFTHEVLKQCQGESLRVLLIRIAKTCAAGLVEYNRNSGDRKEGIPCNDQDVESKLDVDAQCDDEKECSVVHTNFRCDGCQTSPIVGPRFRSTKVTDYDLCHACHGAGKYDTSFSPFEAVTVYMPVHYGIICDGCEMSPIVGTRYKSFETNDFDLCEACEADETYSKHEPFIKIKHPDQAPGHVKVMSSGDVPVMHPFIVCDGCDMSPIVGKRFKSSACEDFDLCEKCHDTGRWEMYGPFSLVEQSWDVRQFMKKGVHELSKSNHHVHHNHLRHQQPPHEHHNECSDDDKFSQAKTELIDRNGDRRFILQELSKKNASCEGDVTIPVGTVVAPETEIMKVWRVKNSGDCVWPEGCMLKMQTGRFGFIPFDGAFSMMNVLVPQLNPGEESQIWVHLTAPIQPARYRAYWRICDPEGVCFGHRFWIDVIVSEREELNVEIVAQQEQTIETSAIEVTVNGSDASTVELEGIDALSSDSEVESYYDIDSDGTSSCDDVKSVSSEEGNMSSDDEISDDSEEENLSDDCYVRYVVNSDQSSSDDGESVSSGEVNDEESEVDDVVIAKQGGELGAETNHAPIEDYELFEDALSVLEAMGFGDKNQNLHVLLELGGNLLDAINNLLID